MRIKPCPLTISCRIDKRNSATCEGRGKVSCKEVSDKVSLRLQMKQGVLLTLLISGKVLPLASNLSKASSSWAMSSGVHFRCHKSGLDRKSSADHTVGPVIFFGKFSYGWMSSGTGSSCPAVSCSVSEIVMLRLVCNNQKRWKVRCFQHKAKGITILIHEPLYMR